MNLICAYLVVLGEWRERHEKLVLPMAQSGLSLTSLLWKANLVLMLCTPEGLSEERPVHTATWLVTEASLWLHGPFNKPCPEAVFKLLSVSFNIRSYSLFISDVLPCYSCWNSTWTGQCSIGSAAFNWLPFCFGQNSSLFGTLKIKEEVGLHLPSEYLDPSSWSLWRLEFKFMIQRRSFHWL